MSSLFSGLFGGDASKAGESKESGGNNLFSSDSKFRRGRQESSPGKEKESNRKKRKSIEAAKEVTTADEDNEEIIAQFESEARAKSQSEASASAASDARGNTGKRLGEDSLEKRQRTLFVGNLPGKMTKKSLKKLFREFGTIESVRFRSQPLDLENKMPYHDTALTRRIAAVKGLVNGERTQKAFVVFKTSEEAHKALALNMTKVQDKHVMVDFAGTRSSEKGGENDSASVQYEPSMSVFLGNLPLDVEEEEIITLFNAADHLPQVQGEIEAVRVVHDKATGLGKGFGYVLFKTTKAAKAALDLNGEKLRDRELRVMKVKPPKPAALSGKNKAGGSQQASKRSKLSAFQRRSSNKSGGKGAPSWQGMKAKSKIGKDKKKDKKKNPLLSEMVKKHTIKSTTKNMQSRKKMAQNQLAKKRDKHDGSKSSKKRLNKKARK